MNNSLFKNRKRPPAPNLNSHPPKQGRMESDDISGSEYDDCANSENDTDEDGVDNGSYGGGDDTNIIDYSEEDVFDLPFETKGSDWKSLYVGQPLYWNYQIHKFYLSFKRKEPNTLVKWDMMLTRQPFRKVFAKFEDRRAITSYLQSKIKDVRKMANYGRSQWAPEEVFKKLKADAIKLYGARYIH